MQSLKKFSPTNGKLKITTIGGGTGSPVVLEALIRAGYGGNLTAISAAMDSGGRTGNIKIDERGQVISIGDWWRNLFALISPADNHRESVQTFIDNLSYTDGRGRNLGYQFGYALLERMNHDYLRAQQEIEKILTIKLQGRAIPVTAIPTDLCFRTSLDDIFKGEHYLDEYKTAKIKVADTWIDPQVAAHPETVKAIKQSDFLIYSPGSLYGSTMVCFLPPGIIEALRESQAKKILITNLISLPLESDNFLPLDFWQLFQKYTTLERPFDSIVVSDLTREEFESHYSELADRYRLMTDSYFLGWNDQQLQPLKDLGVVVAKGSNIFMEVPEKKIIRHDAKKLALVLKEILR